MTGVQSTSLAFQTSSSFSTSSTPPTTMFTFQQSPSPPDFSLTPPPPQPAADALASFSASPSSKPSTFQLFQPRFNFSHEASVALMDHTTRCFDPPSSSSSSNPPAQSKSTDNTFQTESFNLFSSSSTSSNPLKSTGSWSTIRVDQNFSFPSLLDTPIGQADNHSDTTPKSTCIPFPPAQSKSTDNTFQTESFNLFSSSSTSSNPLKSTGSWSTIRVDQNFSFPSMLDTPIGQADNHSDTTPKSTCIPFPPAQSKSTDNTFQTESFNLFSSSSTSSNPLKSTGLWSTIRVDQNFSFPSLLDTPIGQADNRSDTTPKSACIPFPLACGKSGDMAGDRRVLMTLGGIGSSLSSASVFKFANASPPQILKIDPSALARLSLSPSGHKLKSSSPFKLQLPVMDYLSPEEVRASILVLLNMLLLDESASPSAASQLSDILNNQAFTLDLEFNRQNDVDRVTECWPDSISIAICALLDYTASWLSKVADAVAALSCEALKTDTTTAFNFTDSDDGFSDKDSASVASDFKVLLDNSKMRGNIECDLVSKIPITHGRLRSLCKSIHSSTRVKLSSIPLVNGDAGKDLTGLFLALSYALKDLGEGSWQRAKLCLDNLVKDKLFSNLAESFYVGCPNANKLEDSIMSFSIYYSGKSYIKSLHEVYRLSEAVRKILAWEATVSFISLEGSELIKVDEVVAGAKPDNKTDKKKKAMGKGTTILMEFIKDRLQSVTSNINSSSLLDLSDSFLSLLDTKDASFDSLLQKVKEVVDSNENRRLPKIPKGTCDLAIEQMMAVRKKAFSIFAKVCKRHGGKALDTPVYELRETLEEIYGEDSKLLYDLADQGGELCSLQYDLMVPFARYFAMSGITSFKRYQIGKVYKRDKPSKGRCSEFYHYQCDFVIAGDESIRADFEVVKILTELLDELNIGEYEIKLNHQKLLDGMLDICSVPSDKFHTVCLSIDKLNKQTFEEIKKELIDEKGLDIETVEKIGSFVKLTGHPIKLLSLLKEGQLLTNDSSKQALNDLDKLFQLLDTARCVHKVVLDLSLARGLHYYTGVIYEAVSKGPTQVGSIAAGGRYDNLIPKFGRKHVVATGVSLGIERIFTIMEQIQKDNTQLLQASETQVLVSICCDDDNLAVKLVSLCWDADLKAEFLVNKLQSKHFDHAKKFGIPWMVIVGEQEIAKGVVTLKNQDAQVEKEVLQSDFVDELVGLINTPQS